MKDEIAAVLFQLKVLRRAVDSLTSEATRIGATSKLPKDKWVKTHLKEAESALGVAETSLLAALPVLD